MLLTVELDDLIFLRMELLSLTSSPIQVTRHFSHSMGQGNRMSLQCLSLCPIKNFYNVLHCRKCTLNFISVGLVVSPKWR